MGGLCPLTFVFFSGLGGSSLLGGAVMSFPVTTSAALGSSGFAGKKEEWRLQFEPFLLVWLAGRFGFFPVIHYHNKGKENRNGYGLAIFGKMSPNQNTQGKNILPVTGRGQQTHIQMPSASNCSARGVAEGNLLVKQNQQTSHPSMLLHFGMKLCHLPACLPAQSTDAHPPSPAAQTEPISAASHNKARDCLQPRDSSKQPQQRDVVFCISAKSMILFLFSRSETAQRFHEALVCS